jgi:hypothetical protein
MDCRVSAMGVGYEEKYENHQHARIRELVLIKQKSGRQFFKMPGLPIQRFRPSGS